MRLFGRPAGPLAAALLLAGCLPDLPGIIKLEDRENYLLKPPPAPQGIRKIPLTFALQQISSRSARGVTMRVFNTGKIHTRGEGVSSRKSYHAKVRLDVPVFLVRHSEQGLILIGTGLSPEKSRRGAAPMAALLPYSFQYRQKKDQDIISQLRSSGVDPEAVRWIVVGHWDAGVIGMLDAFPGATVVVSRSEWEWRGTQAAGGASDPLSPAGFEGKIRLRLVDLNTAPAFGAFNNGVDLFDDKSLFLVGLPGRSPGNAGVWVNLDGGPALLAGGAAFVMDNYLDLALPVKSKLVDVEDYWLSLHIIRAMSDAVPRLLVFPGNDLTPLRIAPREDIRAEAGAY